MVHSFLSGFMAASVTKFDLATLFPNWSLRVDVAKWNLFEVAVNNKKRYGSEEVIRPYLFYADPSKY